MIAQKIPLEKTIENAILGLLEASGFDAYKIPRIGVYDAKRKVYRMPKSRHLRKSVGHSDIVLLIKEPRHAVIFLEVKRPKVGKQSDEQKQFQYMIERNGGFYYIVDSIDKMIEILKDISTRLGDSV
jgi:hypothetical protein